MPAVLPAEGNDARGMTCPMPVGSRGCYIMRTSGEDVSLYFYAGVFSDASFVEHYSAFTGKAVSGLDGCCLAFTISVSTAVARGVMGDVGAA